MFNEIQKHPELFRTDIVKPDKGNQGNEEELKTGSRSGKRNKNKNNKAVQEALEEAKLEEKKADNKARIAKIEQEGGEVDIFSAVQLNLTDPEIGKWTTIKIHSDETYFRLSLN